MVPTKQRINSNQVPDFSTVKGEAQKRLFDLLDKFEGTKTIIWDDQLIGPFEFVANASLLKQHDTTRLFRLSDVKSAVFNDIRTDYTLFFIRKDYAVAKYIAELLQRADKVLLSKTSLVLVPHRCASIERLFELSKVDLDRLNSIEELQIELFVLDTDILSLENEHVYKDLYLNSDHSGAYQIAQGLLKLQDIYGSIPRISGQGRAAKLVCDLLLKNRKLHPRNEAPPSSQIHQLILIDRRIDLVTPLLTQLTYEGLLDEIFGINYGTITLPSEKFDQPDEKKGSQNGTQAQQADKVKETKRFELRSSEDLFARLRDCHINAVADVLRQSAKNLQNEYDECNTEGKTILEIGKIVKRLNYLKVAKKSQGNQVTIAELVNEQTLKAEFIYGLRIEHELLQEDKLNRVVPDIDVKLLRQEPPLHVLRLICVQSIINNGLKSKIIDYYKRELIQNYGPEYLTFILQLERANLLLSREKFHETGSFSQLKSRFNLVKDDVDECNPNHFSYVYGGYTPLTVAVARLFAQSAPGPLLRTLSDNLKLLPEPTVIHTDSSSNQGRPIQQQQQSQSRSSSVAASQQTPSEASGSLTSNAMAAASLLISAGVAAGSATGLRMRRNSITSSQSSSSEPTKNVLVFFIGGCTFAEISALRYLSQQEENNCSFLIGTSKIINGKTFLKSIWPSVEKQRSF